MIFIRITAIGEERKHKIIYQNLLLAIIQLHLTIFFFFDNDARSHDQLFLRSHSDSRRYRNSAIRGPSVRMSCDVYTAQHRVAKHSWSARGAHQRLCSRNPLAPSTMPSAFRSLTARRELVRARFASLSLLESLYTHMRGVSRPFFVVDPRARMPIHTVRKEANVMRGTQSFSFYTAAGRASIEFDAVAVF